jgi:hypothetical protein
MKKFVPRELVVKPTDEFEVFNYDAATEDTPPEAFKAIRVEQTEGTADSADEAENENFYGPNDTELF